MYKLVSILGLVLALSVAACSRQQSDWEKTRAANTTDAYEQFLKKYPGGEFTAQAQARARELYEEREWQKARDLDSIDAYQSFLKQYPDGKWSQEARIRIENFTLASAPPNGTPADAALPADAAPPPASEPPASAPAVPAAGVPAPRAPAEASASAGKYAVQLGAYKSGEDAAMKRWAELSGKYPKLLEGLSPRISPRKAAAGTLYRLQVANLSGKRARAICGSLKAHAQPCEVLRPRH
jgi:cell division protein FtsN